MKIVYARQKVKKKVIFHTTCDKAVEVLITECCGCQKSKM